MYTRRGVTARQVFQDFVHNFGIFNMAKLSSNISQLLGKINSIKNTFIALYFTSAVLNLIVIFQRTFKSKNISIYSRN